MIAGKTTRLAWLLSAHLAGCSTINFVQYEQPGEPKTTSHWHHATLNGMIELSKPLNISEVCETTTWNKITTEHTLLNWLAEAAVPSYHLLLFYSAWTIEVECYETNRV